MLIAVLVLKMTRSMVLSDVLISFRFVFELLVDFLSTFNTGNDLSFPQQTELHRYQLQLRGAASNIDVVVAVVALTLLVIRVSQSVKEGGRK